MSDTTPEPAEKRDDAGPDAPHVEPATAPAASAAAEPAPNIEPAEPAPAPSAAEPHDTDPDMAAPPSGPVSARGHVNRPADESAPETPVVPAAAAPAAPAPTIEPEPVAASDADIAAAVARTHAEPGATAAGDATVDTASPAQAAAPVIIAGEAAQQQTQQAAQAPAAQAPAAATAAYAAQPSEATWAPEPAAAPPIAPQPVAPIFLQRPEPPKRKSNRGFGILIALVGTALFAVVWAAAVVGVGALLAPGSEFIPALIQFSTHSTAWAPVVAFFIGMVVLIQIVNRARWWAYILGGLFVAVFVYLVYIGAALIDNGFLQKNPGERQILLTQVWVAPFAVLAGVIAREVSIWTGAWLAARGRKLKARNAEAQADYEQQVADAQNQAANAYAQQGY
ncbi:hypothetical protein [Leifsonia sp. TF02-11]|uniref:hypothetical protein n=1 Tax=Leifsonia sp. TF02-11 TaxID=2815212 RepID=UPI001AA0D56D|nr:hypothetical protein [Leifsonia sp. TF02-11]MBO1740306.1 hypothetical protein [Leifsonia sp. TF02-11]